MFVTMFVVWAPRILAILFATFISLFALDVFGGNEPFSKKLLGLSIHLIPTYFIILFVVVAWRLKFAGGVIFIFLGIFFTLYFKTYRGLANFSMISLPLFLIGVLFIVSAVLTRSAV
jgi:hypothetical protein